MANPKGRTLRKPLTRIEFIVAMILLAVLGLIAVSQIPRVLLTRDLLPCQAKLKQIGQAMSMYTEESKGQRFPKPKLDDCNGNIQPWSGAMDLAEVYPEYLTDLDLFVCPSYGPGKTAIEVWDEGKTTNPRWEAVEGYSNNGTVEPCEMLGKPYYYYGWALSELTFGPFPRTEDADPEDVLTENMRKRGWGRSLRVTDEYTPHIHNMRFRLATLSLAEKMKSGDFNRSMQTWDLEYPSGKALKIPFGSEIPSLREGVGRFLMREICNPAAMYTAEKSIVVLHEAVPHVSTIFPHMRRANVLYMDGHVEGIYLGGRTPFPFNEAGQILRDAVEGTLEAPIGDTQRPPQSSALN